MHDAAHCFEAFNGGKQAVRNTIAWKDAFAAELSKNPNESTQNLERHSDFSAIRLLHAKQAEKLAQLQWKSQNDNSSFFLIENTDLRNRYGSLIGKIAASHNWNIDDLTNGLPSQFNAPGGWPSDWRVDPIKIACILRCADAAHLDERRAPDFLFALIRRCGLSLDHWKAQNWLARADLDQSDPTNSSLLITSTRAFKPEETKAWWVAFDAISVLDSEIKACNQLLLSRAQCNNGSPAFQIKNVTGANSPLKASKSIETENWQPTTATIHVGNLERLVGTLGGQSLYGVGDDFSIVVREIIQNSRDAIAARRALNSDYLGNICVKISKKTETKTFVEICDDGVGMSERTMVSTLLDFGTSFWASELVKSEFPGLRSSSFKPVGKYGIGFYSVFMAASEVLVSSRRYDAGIPDVTNLHFPDGITLRPTLSKGGGNNFDPMNSTSVRLTIDEPIDFIKYRLINKGEANEVKIPLKNYLAAITAGLDVSVKLKIDDEALADVHQSIDDLDSPEKIYTWIEDLTFSNIPGSAEISSKEYVLSNYERMRKIHHNGQVLGFAALIDIPPSGNGLQFMTTDTIGGLTNQVRRGTGSYLGYMENHSASAKRDIDKKAIPKDILQSWANEQISILKERNSSSERIYWAASNMSNLDLDPIEVISFPIFFPSGEYVLMTFHDLYEIMLKTPISCLMSRQSSLADTYTHPVSVGGLPTLRPLSNGNLIQLKLENNTPKFPNSLIGCLHRLIHKEGRELSYEVKPEIMKSVLGILDGLVIKIKDL